MGKCWVFDGTTVEITWKHGGFIGFYDGKLWG